MSNSVDPILSQPNDGRVYKPGAAENIEVTFKADGAEVDNRYAITEWWMAKGGIAIIPAGVTHAFRNDSDQRVGILNIFLPGAYEAMMPQIQALFAQR